MTKKILAFVLAAVMVFSCFAVGASAIVADDPKDYPVILVPGYSGSDLDMVHDDGSVERIWALNMDIILERVLARIVDIGKGLVLTAKGQGQWLGEVVGAEAVDILGNMACDSNGESINDIRVAHPTAEEMCMTAVMERNDGENTFEKELFAEISAQIGAENCFFHQSDWRMSAIQCAESLDAFVQQVKEITGKDKVNLIAVSHGGQVLATYLSLFGHKQDVCKAVLTVPAAGGAALAYDIMSENVKLDEYTLIYFIQHGLVSDDDFKWLVKAQELGFLDDVLAGFVPYAKSVIGNFRSIWDFIPAEYYDEMKEQYLDPVENAGIIEYSDRVHYDIMPNYHEALTQCIEEYGIDVSIIAGCGHPSVTGLQANSDAIITTNDSTGAECAEFGKRFNDGYTGLKTSCDNPAHDHISPSYEIDATTAYLPENTWYVEELYHGMTFLDEYSMSLALKLLLTNDIADIYSDPSYPQFHASTNRNNIVYAEFSDSGSAGYLTKNDTALKITNLSSKYPVKITAVTFKGVDMVASTTLLKSIAPGETTTVLFSGRLPSESGRNVQVTVDYICEERILTPNGSRTFNFKLMNGEPVEYDAEKPFVNADYLSTVEEAAGEKASGKLQNTGTLGIVQFIVNYFMAIVRQLGLDALFSLMAK